MDPPTTFSVTLLTSRQTNCQTVQTDSSENNTPSKGDRIEKSMQKFTPKIQRVKNATALIKQNSTNIYSDHNTNPTPYKSNIFGVLHCGTGKRWRPWRTTEVRHICQKIRANKLVAICQKRLSGPVRPAVYHDPCNTDDESSGHVLTDQKQQLTRRNLPSNDHSPTTHCTAAPHNRSVFSRSSPLSKHVLLDICFSQIRKRPQ